MLHTYHLSLILVMLNDNPMIEATSGVIEITDFTSDVIESLLFYMYNDFVDEEKINCNLLKVANKVVYISSSRLQLTTGSCDLSQAEKNIFM